MVLFTLTSIYYIIQKFLVHVNTGSILKFLDVRGSCAIEI